VFSSCLLSVFYDFLDGMNWDQWTQCVEGYHCFSYEGQNIMKKEEKDRKRMETTYLGPVDTARGRMRGVILSHPGSQVWYTVCDM
jgi:hypothetical protein